MKIHIHFDFEKTRIDEVIEGKDADVLVAEIRDRVAKRAGFVLGAVVRGMAPLAFAQEVTRRYAAHSGEKIAVPVDCADFLRLAVDRNFVTVLNG